MRRLLRSRGRPPAIRVAAGLDRVVALTRDGAERVLPWGNDAELEAGLKRLREKLPPGGAPGAAVVLLPPLVDVRRVSLPRLTGTETTLVLERHTARYFPAAREPQVVAWRRVGPRSASPAELLVAAAPAAAVDALRRALESAGFAPGDPAPAHDAWLAVAAGQDGVVAVVHGERVEVLRRAGGRLLDVSTLPADSTRAAGRLAELAGEGRVTVIGAGVGAEAFADATPRASRLEEDPAIVAARGADGPATGRHDGLALVPPALRASRTRRDRRRASALWAAAAAMVVAAGLLELWGVGRELAAVRAERAALADRVAEVMDRRGALTRQVGAIAALDSLEMNAPVWSGLVTELARHLPADAHLAALRAERDSVAIEGVATEAARVFAALREVPGVSRVVARAPIRREQEGPRAVERFSLAARIEPEPAGGGE